MRRTNPPPAYARERKPSAVTYFMSRGGRERRAATDRGEGGGDGCSERERDGERSSLGNLFWSPRRADTQGAGKPITV